MEEESRKAKDEYTECLAERMHFKEYVHERKESLAITQTNIMKSLKNDDRSIEKMCTMVSEAEKTKIGIV